MHPLKPCIIIPTYENPRTLAEVVRSARTQLPDVIVVDDGSGPETQEILAALEGITLLRHEVNRGKGAALRTGLDQAHRLGFTHAISMDSDGQHLAEEIPKFLEAAREHPGAIVLGNRDLQAAGAGPGSKFGRANSNFWTWVITGARLPDTQTGYRCYPTGPLSALAFHCTRFDFEIEVLVRAAWSGIELRSIPIGVRYFAQDAPERVSHLRLTDYLRIAHLNTRFVTQRICLPQPYLHLRCTRAYHEQGLLTRSWLTFRKFFVEDQGSPSRIASGVALGLFWGLAPVWGFQIAITIFFAHLLRLSKPIAVVASHVSFPLVIPWIVVASTFLGRMVLGLPEGVVHVTDLHVESGDVPAWILGSFLLAGGASLAGGISVWLLIHLARWILPRKPDPAADAEEEPEVATHTVEP